MKLALSLAAAGLALAVGSSYADTSNSKDKAKMEQKASPAAGKSAESKKDKGGSSSAGSTAPAAEAYSVGAQRFKALDIDGDGAISKAEAAGNADLVQGFDRADRNRDGKLSRTEYDNLGKPKAKKQQVSR
jgi:hypothetical protein